MVVATPSGITLAPEGGAHQSIGTPLIGIAQDGLAAFEPAYVDELAVIMRWAFDYLQRDGEGDPDETTWLRDQTGGSVYLRLSTRPIEQPGRTMSAGTRQRHRQRRLLGAKAGAELPGRGRLYGQRGAGGDRGHRPDGRGPARCRPARHHLGRPPQCRLDRGRARPPARPGQCHEPYRAADGAALARMRHRQRPRRPSGDARLARRRLWPSHEDPGRGTFRPDRQPRRSAAPLRASTPTPSCMRPRPWRPAGRCAICARLP